MFFTQEDYKKIEKWLLANSIKDTEFTTASTPLKGNEIITLVLNGLNVKVYLSDLVNQIFSLGVSDLINISDKYNETYITLGQAIQLIPHKARKIGLFITYLDANGDWLMYQFQGELVNQWNNITLWENIFDRIEGIDIIDSEDITATFDKDNQASLLLANKPYIKEEYSGLGRIYLRKNIATVVNPTTQCEVTINLLTLGMISKENTIYIIQYDYDLNELTITIPENCVLQFEGGSINKGSIDFNNSIITNKANLKIFDLTNIRGINEIQIDWFATTDITNVLKLFSLENVIIKFGAKYYTADLSNFIMAKNLEFEGINTSKTIIELTNSLNTNYIIGLGYGCKIRNIQLQLKNADYKGEVIRLSNEFASINTSNPLWQLNNIKLSTKWVSPGLNNYKATAIAVYCREFDDDGNKINQPSLSYLRDFNNIYIQYFNKGIDILVKQETAKLEKKIWCNSFLWQNIVIWANIGISFITEGVDSDTGKFSFVNYMYQGDSSYQENEETKYRYGYYGNGADNILLNYTPWDCEYNGCLLGGTLYCSMVNIAKSIMADAGDYSFKIIAGFIQTTFPAKNITLKGDLYDSYTGDNLASISNDGEGFNLKNSNFGKTRIRLRNKYSSVLNAGLDFYNLNNVETYKTDILQSAGNTSPYSIGRDIVESTTLVDTYIAKKYTTRRISIPTLGTNYSILKLSYNRFLFTVKVSALLKSNSCYRLSLSFKDKDGNLINPIENASTGFYMSSAFTPLDTSYANHGSFKIIGGAIGSTTGYIEIETGFRDCKNLLLSFIIASTSSIMLDSKVASIEIKQILQFRERVGDSFINYVNDDSGVIQYNPAVGECCYRTDVYKPYWNKEGTSKWVDANGNLFGVKVIGDRINRPSDVQIGYLYIDTTLNKPIWWDGTKWIDKDGNNADIKTKGTTVQRSTLSSTDDGFEYYDSTLKKKILWNGTAWTNLDGTPLT